MNQIIKLTFVNPSKTVNETFSFITTVFVEGKFSSNKISEMAKEAEGIVRKEHPEFSHLLDYSYYGNDEIAEIIHVKI